MENGGPALEHRSVRRRLGEAESPSPGLGSRHHGDILAQNLSADREQLGGLEQNERGRRPIAKRRAGGRRIYEDVGIDEAHRPSSSYRSSRRRLSPSGQGPRS